jgi:methylated-DNA-[protein]-cysteine S-methyltransferase
MNVYQFRLERMETPLGQMLLVTDEQERLRALDWHDHDERMHDLLRRQYRGHPFVLQESTQASSAITALRAYFDGDLAAIDGLGVATGGTDFQRQVWRALRDIPTGATIIYGELAARIGRPRAVRAVGLANGANPVGIVVPCHRVIGADRSLTGYGGGLDRKRWLLEHEKAIRPRTATLPGFE